MSTQSSSSGNAANQAAGQQTDNQAAGNQPAGSDSAAATNQPATDQSANQPTGKTFTQAEYDAGVAKANKDAEKRVKDAEAKAKLSDDERLKAELADAQTQLRERDARDEVKDAAETLGAKTGARVYKLVKDDLEFDAKGKITNLKDVLATAKKDFPELFGAQPPASQAAGSGKGSADGGAGNQGANKTAGGMNDFIRRATGRS